MPISDTVEKLLPFVGHNWYDIHDQIDEIVHSDGFVYRWLMPDTELHPNDVIGTMPERVNIIVDENTIIQSFTVG